MVSRIVVCLAILLSGTTAAAQVAHVSGTVTYRERIALPPGAAVNVTIDDVSRAGAPVTVAAAEIDRPVQVPVPFDVAVEASRIDMSHRYAVRASITDGGRTLFSTSDATLVLTQGHAATANLVLTLISAPVQPEAAAPATIGPPARLALSTSAVPVSLMLPATFTGALACANCPAAVYQINLLADDAYFARTTYADRRTPPVDEIGSWVLSSDRRVLALESSQGRESVFAIVDDMTLRERDVDGDGGRTASGRDRDLRRAAAFAPIDSALEMEGMYRMRAGRAEFTECTTGETWSVGGNGAQDLDAAYSHAHLAAGEAILMTVMGDVAVRPHGVPGQSAPALAVAHLSSVTADGACAARFSAAPLTTTYWRLVDLDGVPAAISAGSHEAGITFRADSSAFSGTAGCRWLAGDYELAGREDLRLTTAGTLRACAEAAGNGNEDVFALALKNTRRYRIVARSLVLYDEHDAPLARFQAGHAPVAH